MEETISIKDLVRLMLSKLWLIILLFILGGAAGYGYTVATMTLKYQSYTTMYVRNVDAAQQVNIINTNDLNFAKQLVNTYIAVLKSDTIMEEAGNMLLAKYGRERMEEVFTLAPDGTITPASLRSCLTMSSVDNTEVMKISALTTDAEVSAALCRTITMLAPDFLGRVVGAGSVEVIDAAKPNHTPIGPSIPKNILIGALAGAVLAMAVIFLMDFFDNTIRVSETLSEQYKHAILGEIPATEYATKGKGFRKSRKKDHSEHRYLITEDTTPFYVVESYKAMRTNLIFALSTSDKKIFGVSSANAGEGKSTTASNIALALSQLENTKVLLIDADMRRPMQHETFQIKNKLGLSSLLGKMNKTEDCIKKQVKPNLDLMPSGPQPPNPAELLGSAQMERVLTDLSAKYDYIIIDMPPINVVSDPLSVSRLIAGIVVAIKYGSTTFDDIDEVMRRTELSDMKVLGYAMTRVKQAAGGSSYYHKKYYRRYGYGYGYSKKPNAAYAQQSEEKRDDAKHEN